VPQSIIVSLALGVPIRLSFNNEDIVFSKGVSESNLFGSPRSSKPDLSDSVYYNGGAGHHRYTTLRHSGTMDQLLLSDAQNRDLEEDEKRPFELLQDELFQILEDDHGFSLFRQLLHQEFPQEILVFWKECLSFKKQANAYNRSFQNLFVRNEDTKHSLERCAFEIFNTHKLALESFLTQSTLNNLERTLNTFFQLKSTSLLINSNVFDGAIREIHSTL